MYYRLIITLGFLSFYIINTGKATDNRYLRSINSKISYSIIRFNIEFIVFWSFFNRLYNSCYRSERSVLFLKEIDIVILLLK